MSVVPRVALTKHEAAEALGVSVAHFERHVQPEIRVIRSGRLVRVPVNELKRWAHEHSARALESEGRPPIRLAGRD